MVQRPLLVVVAVVVVVFMLPMQVLVLAVAAEHLVVGAAAVEFLYLQLRHTPLDQAVTAALVV
jgi:hypothetical protein